MTCVHLFLSQRHDIFFLPRARVSEDDPTIAKDFRKLPRKFRSSEVSQCVWDRLKKNNPRGFFPSKSVSLGLKRDLNGLFLSQIGLSLHFSVANWSFKATTSHR